MISCSRLSEGCRSVNVREPNPDLFEIDVTRIPGVGPQRAARLARLGISNVAALLFYAPFRYEETAHTADSLAGEGQISVAAVVSGPVSVRLRGKRSMVYVPVRVGARELRALFFNQPYLRHQLSVGRQVRITGRYDSKANTLIASRCDLRKDDPMDTGLLPVYRVTEDLPVSALRSIVASALRAFGSQLSDDLPATLRERFKLIPLPTALHQLHFPADAEALRQARRRVVFEEFLKFQLRMQGFRRWRLNVRRPLLHDDALRQGARAFVEQLPFPLTRDQEAAMSAVLSDLAQERPMHRLLQGDVGCGKTAVAFAAAAAVARAGWQIAYMAPTGILAAQQLGEARKFLNVSGLRVDGLFGGQPTAHRRTVASQLADGTLDMVIGTHALAAQGLRFDRLRLVIADEQHRFGVGIRKMLREKGRQVDVLQLSATPIPRTLALTLHGDIAVTTIRELPPGRKPVRTRWLRQSEEAVALKLVRQELSKGHQAFLIAPRIDSDPEGICLESVQALYERMTEELAGWRIGLIHGAMPEADRDQTMQSFAEGKIHVLVATTIVEVGVSVPKASVMVVYGADRFGLATLHQLRGRIGRGAAAAECVLLADPTTDAAAARLRTMTETHDGFLIAQRDLMMRGPGEVLGERQSGLPEFAVGDPIRDFKIMEVARDVARELLDGDDFWLLPEYGRLRAIVLSEYDVHSDS